MKNCVYVGGSLELGRAGFFSGPPRLIDELQLPAREVRYVIDAGEAINAHIQGV